MVQYIDTQPEKTIPMTGPTIYHACITILQACLVYILDASLPHIVDASPPVLVDASPPVLVDASPLLLVDASPPHRVDASPPHMVDASPPPLVDASPPHMVDASPPPLPRALGAWVLCLLIRWRRFAFFAALLCLLPTLVNTFVPSVMDAGWARLLFLYFLFSSL
jgi:hypothetical protein